MSIRTAPTGTARRRSTGRSSSTIGLAVELLIRAGANPKATNRYGVAPLSLACTNGNAAIIGRLLDAGADPNATAPGGETPLMTASRTGKVDAVEILLGSRRRRECTRERPRTNRVDVGGGRRARVSDSRARRGRSRRQCAIPSADFRLRYRWSRRRNSRTSPSQADSGAPRPAPAQTARPLPDYFVRSNGGALNTPMVIDSMTPLMFAVRAGRFDAVRTLLESGGASVNETASNGLSVLILAIINAHYELAAYLLDKGADPNAAGQGWTALHQVVTTPRLSYGRFPHPPQTGRAVSVGARDQAHRARGRRQRAHDDGHAGGRLSDPDEQTGRDAVAARRQGGLP